MLLIGVALTKTGMAQDIPKVKMLLEEIPQWRAFPDCDKFNSLEKTACRYTKTPDVKEIKRNLKSEKVSIWSEGNRLNIAYRIEDDSVRNVHVQGGIQLPLSNITDTDIWFLSLNIPDLKKAVISINFTYQSSGSFVNDRTSIQEWRGIEAPPKSKRTKDLSQRLRVDSLWSKELKDWRKITVYDPPKAKYKDHIPVIYFADGQGLKGYAEIVDQLILKGNLPPTAFVGIWVNRGVIDTSKPPVPVNSFRTIEYHEGVENFPGADSVKVAKHHAAHINFFTIEVPSWVEKRYGFSDDPAYKAIQGVSSGANFALLMGRQKPDQYNLIIANSLGPSTVKKTPSVGWQNAIPHYLSAGILEQKKMRENLKALADSLKKYNVPVKYVVYPSGHDILNWQEQLPEAISWWLKQAK